MGESKSDVLKESQGSVEHDELGGVPDSFAELNTSSSQINVLVVWTRRYECNRFHGNENCNPSQNSGNAVRAFIDESIRNFQAALRNSQIGATARLVHARRHNQFPEDGMTAD